MKSYLFKFGSNRSNETKRILLVLVLAGIILGGCARQTVVLGGLASSDAVTVSEIYAQALEKAGYKVVRQYGQESAGLHRALLSGEIDIYAEYSGAALTRILGGEKTPDQYSAYDAASAKYRELGLVLLEPLPANNALGLAVLQERADALGIKTFTDLQEKAADLSLAYTGNFFDDPEGFTLLEAVYGTFPFKEITAVSGGDELHHLLHSKSVDVIPLGSNDGHLADPLHKILRDNFHAFVPQTLVPVARREYIEQNKKIRDILNPLSASLNDKAVINLNNQTEIQKIPYPQAAKTYLKTSGFF
ncbi:MAG: hypothetical protein LBJ31_01850 [Treponema sp.]|jgi:osmoprotectant transport system substrate-binding protein|nr:hypothetical protein [Treponema sp.]